MLLKSLFLYPFCFIISIAFLSLFFITSKKEKWDIFSSSSFECGYTSYFYSRHSFSIHYFLIGMIFLFLDLELCVIMPLANMVLKSFNLMNMVIFFVFFLLWGLLKEWKEGKLEWLK